MRKETVLAVVFCAALALFAVSAQASYVVFDDLATSGGFGAVPSTYQGYQWTGFGVVSQQYYNATYGNAITFPSGPNAAYNDGGAVVTMTGTGTPFIFNGADFWSWTMGPAITGGLSTYYLHVTGSLNGVPLPAEQLIDLTINPGAPQLTHFAPTEFGWLVDKVMFTTDAQGGGGYWLMDCVNVAAAPAVPLPPSLYLLAAGLVGTLVARRRKAHDLT